jgi:hypothetical protein
MLDASSNAETSVRAGVVRIVMKPNSIVSLAHYKARRLGEAKKEKAIAEQTFPDERRLWELLDKNICLSVWIKAN